MSTTTTNFGLIKPAVNDPVDQDLWGGYLNSDLDSIDGLLKVSRDVLINAQTGSYTVVTGDRNKVVTIDATAAVSTVGLPTAASAGAGFRVTIKKIDSSTNSVTIDGSGSETIDGDLTVIISDRYTAYTLVCDGSNWSVQSKYSKVGLTNRETFTADGTHVAKSTKVRFYVYGAGGGAGADNDGIAGTASTVTDGVTLVTANGGGAGKAAHAEFAAPAHGTATNGDSNMTGSGMSGGIAAYQISGAIDGAGTNGGNGALAIKDYSTSIGTSFTVTVGVGGAAGSGGGTSQGGVNGIVIAEW